ncbi:MAG TPA: hypothetical protein VL172_21445, partial [Kofleriaceae bacterium]|nr:hypothetical protein [Kofleriaceae bacterium]
MSLVHQEMLEQRAEGLTAAELNGLEMVIVELDPPDAPVRALLDVYFYNDRGVADMVADTSDLPRHRFPIVGGQRRRAGAQAGQVQVTAVAAGAEDRALRLTVEPVGDYSTYRLTIQFRDIDPVFSELPFKFRPGCFTTDCIERDAGEPPPATDPGIDYTAKDYDSFRHTLIAAMGRRMPGWAPTSEADLSQTLIDYLAAAADELSDYQDRVVNERALGSARSRVSLARHARLMDYHIHQGNQAATWLALDMDAGIDRPLEAGHAATTADGNQVYELQDEDPPPQLLALANGLRLYTWSDARPGLEAGATTADVALLDAGEAPTAANLAAAQARGDRLAQLIAERKLTRL